VSGDFQFSTVLKVEKHLLAIASGAGPQDDFTVGIDELNGRFGGVLGADIDAFDDAVRLGTIEHDFERAVELLGNFRGNVLVEVVVHFFNVDLLHVEQGWIGLSESDGDASDEHEAG
jgi:hypothetical protein